MIINCRFWGVGWRTNTSYEHKVPKSTRRRDRDQDLIVLPSIPGRTALLKAVYLLQIAAEVKHALRPQYLYAAYSLDEAFDRFTAPPALPEIDRWNCDIGHAKANPKPIYKARKHCYGQVRQWPSSHFGDAEHE